MNTDQKEEINRYFDEESEKLTKIKDRLTSEDFNNEIKNINKIWSDKVTEFIDYGQPLKLVILAEAPLSDEKYFYKKPGNFLAGFRSHFHIDKKNKEELYQTLLENGILLLDLYEYPLPSSIYKKSEQHFRNEKYIIDRLNKIDELLDDDTKFVFRYKTLIPRFDPVETSCFKNYRDKFIINGKKGPHWLYKNENSKVLNNNIAGLFQNK